MVWTCSTTTIIRDGKCISAVAWYKVFTEEYEVNLWAWRAWCCFVIRIFSSFTIARAPRVKVINFTVRTAVIAISWRWDRWSVPAIQPTVAWLGIKITRNDYSTPAVVVLFKLSINLSELNDICWLGGICRRKFYQISLNRYVGRAEGIWSLTYHRTD